MDIRYVVELQQSDNNPDDLILPLPDDLCNILDWRIDDTLLFKIKGDSVIVENLSKEQRENLS